MRLAALVSHLILCLFSANITKGQECNNWLYLPSAPSYADAGEIDVSGDQITVEAIFNRTQAYSGGPLWAGDLVSKHTDPADVNYLLRPNSAEITTSNGYFSTPQICEIELNKTYHVAMVYDGTTLKFFRNGFLLSQVAASGDLFQNDIATRIGFYEPLFHPTNFLGYIDEVRIWNVARTQEQIRANMNSSLTMPASQTGLVAYYTFEDLINKQGNAAYNLNLSPNARINRSNPQCQLVVDSCGILSGPDSIIHNNDTTVCAYSSVKLRTLSAKSYRWSPSTYLDNANSSSPTSTPQQTMKYYVEATLWDNTITRDSITISVLPAPDVRVSDDTLVCRGSLVSLNASGGGTYLWTPDSHLSDPNSSVTVAAPDITTTYLVRVTGANGCSRNDSVTISVHQPPPFSATGNLSVCDGDSTILVASGGDQYAWTPASQVSEPASASTLARPIASTTFSVTISESTCGSDTTIILPVEVHPDPVVLATSSNDLNCTTPTSQLNASGAYSYLWTPAHGMDNPQLANPIASVDTTTTFTVTGTSEFGCSSTSSVVVAVEKGGIPTFLVPNAFTPNGDGRNDCFGLKRWGNVSVKQFTIYNRWGQIVFQTKDASQCWDGTFNGIKQQAGGYAFVIDSDTFCGPVRRTGMVTLIR